MNPIRFSVCRPLAPAGKDPLLEIVALRGECRGID